MYKVTCEGTVIAWEFCYIEGNQTVTFYPSIWMPSDDNGTNNYKLVKSSNVTFIPTRVGNNDSDKILCQMFNLSEADQFIAPAGSIVGLYSNIRGMPQSLLRTNNMGQSVTTYQFPRNRSDVNINDANIVRYHIALRLHLGKLF